jgi:hypothetical protein
MGFFKKLMFCKKRRGNVSPVMIDASVDTEEPRKCDVGRNTEGVVYEGDMNSHQSPPPADYSPPEWPQSYSHYVPPPQEYEECGQSYSHGAPAPEYAELWGLYELVGYSSPSAYSSGWFGASPFYVPTP